MNASEHLERLLAARRILVVGAHPDDPDAFAAGTVALWTASGAEVSYLVVTSGDKGVPDDEPDPRRFVEIREEEQRRSAALLGVSDVTFLRYTDGEVFDSLPLRGAIVREIRRTRADLVLSHDPFTREFRWHPDHREVGLAALAATFPSCRLASFFPEHRAEGLEPHSVHMFVAGGSDQPNVWVDISDTFDQKIAALRLHESQESAFAGGLEHRIRLRAEQQGANGGLELAEEFRFGWLD